ncbi:PREDICTED: cysteine-rich repeat secretory protein 2 [Tarenaya hassleriana]|uniref:cysteine-rich repeat secretory protein 2 n=1 Tax=Tarenaya hassleriana TaxID=28532 RepID=UPI0008FD73A9|nr:PREDICTED: cysteine-rich repeat secretory protein 2 [Tarenaya hassleriana]
MWKTKTPILCLLIAAAISAKPSSSATDTFVYGGCSQLKFSPASAYESNLNSLLSSLVSSAALGRFANFTVPGGGSTVYGLFQCRGDLDAGACSACVSRAVSQLGNICLDACGGVLQLEGCLVRYDNVSFLGAEDKTLVLKKCGPNIGFDGQDVLTRRDDVVGSLGSSGGSYRVGGTGDVQGVAQCVGDLSPSECQDCLSEATGRLRSDCPMAKSADVYLAKCYARYHSGDSGSSGGGTDKDKDQDVEKTLAIIIGIVTLTILLVIFLSFIGKQCRKLQDGK